MIKVERGLTWGASSSKPSNAFLAMGSLDEVRGWHRGKVDWMDNDNEGGPSSPLVQPSSPPSSILSPI